MVKVLFITNKYVSGKGNQKFYPYFLKYLQDNLNEKDFDLRFVFFSDLFKESVLTKNNYWYDENNIKEVENAELKAEANRIEHEYKFTFKQAYYPEMIQASQYTYQQNLRTIHLPERIISNIDHLISKFNYTKKLILGENIDIVITDQSTDAENEFARSICYIHKKVFLRIWPDFIGRRVIHREYSFGNNEIVQAIYNPAFDLGKTERYLDDYLFNKRSPYPPAVFYSEPKSLLIRFKNVLQNKSFSQVIIFSVRKIFVRIKYIYTKLYFLVERMRKNLLENKFDKNRNYLFWGFHLTTEATISLRGLPFLTQTSLIESISRVLPYGKYLYVREHPLWVDNYKYEHLAKLSKLPNVRIISTKVSIHDILKNCEGIITYNSTTGIEALMHGKPVLSFSPNAYYKNHSAVLFCSDLYELGSKLAKLVNTEVNREDTINYLQKMFQISNDVPLEAEAFVSKEDAQQKAIKLSRHLKVAFDICLQDKKTVDA